MTHVVTYVEVMATASAEARTALARYRDATRSEDGHVRCEIVRRLGQPHHLAILEIWKDPQAFETHRTSANARDLRETIDAIRTAPIDERVHAAVSVGPLQPGVADDSICVLTHVDVIPPRKDDGLAAVTRLADESRPAAGNLRFEVVQQASRPNHFTIVEIWKDAKAVEAHSTAEATRRFRDTLGPISGALYDERLFRAID